MADSSHGSTTPDVYKVKEGLLLKTFLDKSRSDKAKVLRLQQLKNFEERQDLVIDNTLLHIKKQENINRHVVFSPSSLIQDAIKEGNKYEVLECLSSGVPVNFKNVHGEGMPLLHQACVYDDYIIAQALIKKDASVDIKDDYGSTPLHICCLWDSMKCAQLLLANHANANILDTDSNFAIDVAPENSHMKSMMRKHMQQKLKINDDQLHSLRNKTQKAMVQDIRKVLEEGKSVDTPSTEGISLLHIAVTNGYVTAARMLLENSANVNAANNQLWTPLHCAAKYRQATMVRLLLSHYANPHAKTVSSLTPRELAKDAEIIKMLLNAEETFLDLPKQRTPAKPKRFSASLLDQCDNEEEISLVRTRVISSIKISKRDISKEKELVRGLADELKQELKAEMCFEPPDSKTSLQSIPTWHQLAPPPIPPRDDPPEIQSPVATLQKKKKKQPPRTNHVHDERLLKAVITIQRALRCHLSSKRVTSPLAAALKAIEDYGNSFFDQMVIQNAEDIARESDHQRTLRSQYRNSWSVDFRPTSGKTAQGRPLSTGTIPMAHSADPNAIWLPQSSIQNTYSHIPPDPMPDYWNTLPRNIGSNRRHKSLKVRNSGSTDSGVSFDSNSKNYLELVGTVKRSLSISEQGGLPPPHPQASLLRKQSISSIRPPSQPTYRMPPLTPTVATLINTATVTEEQPSTDYLTPVTSTPPSNFHLYSNATLPINYHSSKQRDHRYGTLLSNRGTILRDSRLKTLSQTSGHSANRHSWNCEQEESSTNFGCSMSTAPSCSLVTPPASLESMQFTDNIQCSIDSIPNSASTSSIPSSSGGRRNSKGSDGMPPPPPPRRDPSTRLSESSENIVNSSSRKGSFGSFNPPISRSIQPNFSLPLKKPYDRDSSVGMPTDSSPEDELPTIPPPLPLYTPQALTAKNSHPVLDDMDLPAPPPPDVLLYNTLKNMGSMQRRRQQPQMDAYLDLPPPPPTL
ncbi:unnamed protein product [Clavelina lepadiformis]|uniref:Uncharacterized protein n=1 Tax=Clavelina lepadiformis TaxID=159417 RepID=A0ABP0GFS8_CLALP